MARWILALVLLLSPAAAQAHSCGSHEAASAHGPLDPAAAADLDGSASGPGDAHPQAPPAEGHVLEVVTLNTWGLPAPLAPDRKGRLPRIHRALRAGGFDIVGLQEVWNGARRLLRDDDLHLPRAEGDSGLALLSPHRVESLRHVRFERAAGFDVFKAKGLFDVTLVLPEVGRLRVIVTHLQAGRGKRAVAARSAQVEQILEHLAEIEVPVVLMGDLNLYDDIPADARSLARLARAGLVDAPAELGRARATYPGHRARLDRVYVRCSDELCLHPEAALALVGLQDLSDHQPVHVRLRAHRPARTAGGHALR